MGNSNGREEEEEDSENGDVDDEAVNVAVNASGDLMMSSPPRQCRSPPLFSSQVPDIPLQRKGGPSLTNKLQKNDSQRAVDHVLGQGIPIIITWSFGGNNVAVEGSWDNWTARKTLQRSPKDHSILLVLPAGIYHYKFIVDGELRYIHDLPSEADEKGCVCNLLDVNDHVPENLDSVTEFEAPPSPDSSYSQSLTVDEDFSKDPVPVPPQLQSTILGSENCKEIVSSKPQHVVLNHMFIQKGWSSESVVALGLTHRFQSKYVTVVLYKPLKRQS